MTGMGQCSRIRAPRAFYDGGQFGVYSARHARGRSIFDHITAKERKGTATVGHRRNMSSVHLLSSMSVTSGLSQDVGGSTEYYHAHYALSDSTIIFLTSERVVSVHVSKYNTQPSSAGSPRSLHDVSTSISEAHLGPHFGDGVRLPSSPGNKSLSRKPSRFKSWASHLFKSSKNRGSVVGGDEPPPFSLSTGEHSISSIHRRDTSLSGIQRFRKYADVAVFANRLLHPHNSHSRHLSESLSQASEGNGDDDDSVHYVYKTVWSVPYENLKAINPEYVPTPVSAEHSSQPSTEDERKHTADSAESEPMEETLRISKLVVRCRLPFGALSSESVDALATVEDHVSDKVYTLSVATSHQADASCIVEEALHCAQQWQKSNGVAPPILSRQYPQEVADSHHARSPLSSTPSETTANPYSMVIPEEGDGVLSDIDSASEEDESEHWEDDGSEAGRSGRHSRISGKGSVANRSTTRDHVSDAGSDLALSRSSSRRAPAAGDAAARKKSRFVRPSLDFHETGLLSPGFEEPQMATPRETNTSWVQKVAWTEARSPVTPQPSGSVDDGGGFDHPRRTRGFKNTPYGNVRRLSPMAPISTSPHVGDGRDSDSHKSKRKGRGSASSVRWKVQPGRLDDNLSSSADHVLPLQEEVVPVFTASVRPSASPLATPVPARNALPMGPLRLSRALTRSDSETMESSLKKKHKLLKELSSHKPFLRASLNIALAAKDLMGPAATEGRKRFPDTYVSLTFDGKKFKTEVLRKTNKPHWNKTISLNVSKAQLESAVGLKVKAITHSVKKSVVGYTIISVRDLVSWAITGEDRVVPLTSPSSKGGNEDDAASGSSVGSIVLSVSSPECVSGMPLEVRYRSLVEEISAIENSLAAHNPQAYDSDTNSIASAPATLNRPSIVITRPEPVPEEDEETDPTTSKHNSGGPSSESNKGGPQKPPTIVHKDDRTAQMRNEASEGAEALAILAKQSSLDDLVGAEAAKGGSDRDLVKGNSAKGGTDGKTTTQKPIKKRQDEYKDVGKHANLSLTPSATATGRYSAPSSASNSPRSRSYSRSLGQEVEDSSFYSPSKNDLSVVPPLLREESPMSTTSSVNPGPPLRRSTSMEEVSEQALSRKASLALQHNFNELRKKLQNETQLRLAAERELDETRQRLDEAYGTIRDLEVAEDEYKASLADPTFAGSEKAAELQRQVTVLQSELSSHKAQDLQWASRLASSEALIENQKVEEMYLRNTLRDVQKELRDYEKQATSFAHVLRSHKNHITELVEENKRLQKQLRKEKDVSKTAQGHLQETQVAFDELREQALQLQDMLIDSTQHSEWLEAELARRQQYQATDHVLQSELSQSMAATLTRAGEVRAEAEELESRYRDVKEVDDEIHNLRNRAHAYAEKLRELFALLKDRDRQIHHLTATTTNLTTLLCSEQRKTFTSLLAPLVRHSGPPTTTRGRVQVDGEPSVTPTADRRLDLSAVLREESLSVIGSPMPGSHFLTPSAGGRLQQ